jgi:ParB family chromosome partitioning protein
MSKRGGLGRGLSALIPGAPETGEGVSGLLEVPVNAVSPNPKQPRTQWDEEEIQALAASIREVGILQPIVVRSAGENGYELVAGERRLRAAKVAGLATVPVVLRETDDSDLLREALIENIHRQDLGPIELAEAFRQLLEELGLKQEDLAERVGVSRSHIANTIRLLQLPLETQQLLTDAKIQAGHARALLALGDADAVNTLALRVAAEDLSVRETEDLVRRYLEPPKEQQQATQDVATTPAADPAMAEVEEILSEQLDTGPDPVREEARPRGHRVRIGRRPRADRLGDRRVGPGSLP